MKENKLFLPEIASRNILIYIFNHRLVRGYYVFNQLIPQTIKD